MKNCKKDNCSNSVFSKGLCKFHQPKKEKKRLDYQTDDLSILNTTDLKKLADYWLRQFLLFTAEKRNGKIYCPIKKQWYSEDKIQVAHFCDRAFMCTRYSLDNCHLISESSNSWDAQIPKEGYKSKHHYEYEVWLKEKIGEKKFEENLQKSKEFCTFAKEDYIEIIKQFKNGCKR